MMKKWKPIKYSSNKNGVPSERKRSRDLKFEVEVEELEVTCSGKCMEVNESSDFKDRKSVV